MLFERERFRAAVLHIIWRTASMDDFGATKLNKVLWFADARAFEAFGKSITGESYIRQKFGPVPRHIEETLSELVEAGDIQTWSEPFYEIQVKRFTTHEPPDVSMFSAEELGFIDWWISHVAQHHTATSISEQSHDYGWKIVPEGEEIPLKAFLAKRIRLPQTEEELGWATSAAKELAS